jgi:hypothetical protein
VAGPASLMGFAVAGSLEDLVKFYFDQWSDIIHNDCFEKRQTNTSGNAKGQA